jgi:hypothetical protein
VSSSSSSSSSNGRYIDCSTLTYATSVAIRVVIVIRRKRCQPSVIFVLASQCRPHSVLLSSAAHCPRRFLFWDRGGYIACIKSRSEFRCRGDVYPSSHVRLTSGILQLLFFLASLVCWLFLVSMAFGIALSPTHVCMLFITGSRETKFSTNSKSLFRPRINNKKFEASLTSLD